MAQLSTFASLPVAAALGCGRQVCTPAGTRDHDSHPHASYAHTPTQPHTRTHRMQERAAKLDKAFPVGDRLVIVDHVVSYEENVPTIPFIHTALSKRERAHESFISGSMRPKNAAQCSARRSSCPGAALRRAAAQRHLGSRRSS
jgi:hypothetical protein